MKRAAFFLLAAACGGRSAAVPEAALEAYHRGDLDGAGQLLRGARGTDALRLRAKILLLKNRPREAADAIGAIPEKERDLHAWQDLALACVRSDEFADASRLFRLLGEEISAQKYAALAKNTGYLLAGDAEETRVEFAADEPLALVLARVNGKTGAFTLDTGAGEVVLDRDYAKAAGVKGIGLRTEAFRGTFDQGIADELTLGRFAVRNVPVQLGRTARAGSMRVDGAIGLSLLMHFDFTIDYRRSRLVLRRVGRAGDPFDRSTGAEAGLPALIAGDRHLLVPAKADGKTETLACLATGLAGLAAAPSASHLQQHGPAQVVTLGSLEVPRPGTDTRPFPAGLDVSLGLPVGFVLGHDAFKGRSVRLDPRAMRLVIE
jgi:hypothetical protein